MEVLIDLYIKGLIIISIIEIIMILLYLLVIFIRGNLKRRAFQKLVLELLMVFFSTVPILSFAYIAIMMMIKANNLS